MNDEHPQVIDSGEGYTIVYKGKNLYSPHEPKKKVEKKISSLTIIENSLLFIPSPLLFYGMGNLIKKLPDSCCILCVEADQKLMALSLTYVEKDLLNHHQLTFIRTDSISSLTKVLDTMGLDHIRRVVLFTVSGGYSLYSSIYRDQFVFIERYIQQHWQNKMTMIHMSQLWYRNIFKNLKRNTPCHYIDDCIIQAPILVAGAGESLELSIPLLKKIRNSVYLLAVDTAVPTLVQSGFQPDGICIVEAQITNGKDFIGAITNASHVFCDISSHPSVISLFSHKLYYFHSTFTDSSLFKRLQHFDLLPVAIPPLGSVGVVALYVAATLTDTTIFFTGLDFSFSLGKPHSRGALSHTQVLYTATRLFPVELIISSLERPLYSVKDKFGKRCFTDIVLHSYVQRIQEIIDRYGRIYDLGKKGLSTGATILATEKECRDEMEAGSEEHTHCFTQNNTVTRSWRDAVEFLQQEQHILIETRNVIERFLNGIETDSNRLKQQLRVTDYTYAHFPDTEVLPTTDVSFLKRVHYSVQTYIKLVGNSLAE